MSERGFFFGCSVALEKRSSNSLALMMFGSSREPHRVLLLEKRFGSVNQFRMLELVSVHQNRG